MGDSCHSATRPDLRIWDSGNSHSRGKKSLFICICKALYPGSEQGVFVGAGDAHSQGIISWLYHSQLAEANMAHAGFHSLCLFVQGGMQAQVIHGVFDPRRWNSSMNDRAKLSLINNNIFFQGSSKAIECSRTGSHQPGQQNF